MSLERRVAMKKYVRTRLSWMVTPVWGFGHLYLLVILRRVLPYALVIAG